MTPLPLTRCHGAVALLCSIMGANSYVSSVYMEILCVSLFSWVLSDETEARLMGTETIYF